ncbi:hypothetical protein MAPG_08864 [Magnaporthiopsis poae ATCC 64411]|uniref:DUF7357 domain-containing protein n=1 Tax=Magnaporthiopsis poae (strain ATCC 64411 / 73-15) TaxID=644358 RepID=A0A0C4E8G3_MAGP6|nr:hypothetical protein MAPG_08864 [Magnaporthiopsis poae ATCC 64411]
MANSMRLRLVVRRHGLPDTRVLFSVPLDDDPTIAQFLELVNVTVPLESADWGLDDYAVELRNPSGGAFEALHFQPVASILRQDEEVYIRPLTTPDLKKRIISGRHQISQDGKHLVDGVPFGRPLLREPRDRPVLQIPPRKRRRLLAQDPASPAAEDDWDDEDDDEEDEDFQPLQLTQHGEPLDAEEDEQDGSFSADGDEDDMDLDDEDAPEIDDQELTALRLENDDVYAGQHLAQPSLPSSPPAPSDEQGQPAKAAEHDTDVDSDSDADIIELKSSMAFAFPSASQAAVSRAFRKCHARKGTYVARKIFKLLKKRHVPQISYRRVKHNYLARARAAAGSPSRSHQDADMHESDADDESDDASYAGERTPEGSDSGDGNAQEMQSLSGSTAYDSPSGSPGATGQTAQSGSDADSESESDDASDPDDDEGLGDSVHDGNDNEDEADAAAQTGLPASDEAESEGEGGGDGSDSDDSGGNQEAADQKESSSESSSDDSSETNSQDSSESSSEESSESSEDEEESEETGSDSSSGSESVSDSSDDEPPEEMSARPPASTPAIEPQPAAGSAAPEEDKAGEPCGAPAQGTTKTRNRNARRRAKNTLLKNGELEERKKALLAAIGCDPEDPGPPAPVAGPDGSPGPAASPSGDDADPWSIKINYHAVECAQKEVALSTPPFPFVQRWDPSQRKQRKRKQWPQSDCYEEGHADGRRPGKKFRFADEAEETVEELNYDEVDVDVEVGDTQVDVAHETSLVDSQLTDCDDLPSLPSDLTTLPVFHPSDAQLSMVITWKKWLLSEATRWEPQIVDVTAVIGRVNEDNQTLDVMMAKRDRGQFNFAKQFNKETGERQYRTFDPPEFSDDDEPDPEAEKAWNEGWRTVAFVDMIEPRILQAAMASFNDEPATQDSQALLHGPTNLRVSEQVDSSVVVPDSQAPRNMNDTTTTTEGKSTTSGETDNQTSKGVKAPESCVPDTNQDTSTSASASRPQQAAQVPSYGDGDGDALILDDDELMAANSSANNAATGTNALISVPVLGQYSLPPCQPVDDSDSPSRQLIGDAVTDPKSEVTSQQVSYPQLQVPSSSVGSVRSGRQPDADDNMDMAPDAFSNAVDTDDDNENDDHVATPRASSKPETGQQQPQTPAKSGKDAQEKAPSFIKQSRSQLMTSIEAVQPSQQVKKEDIKPEPASFAASVSPPSHSTRGAIKGALFGQSTTKKPASSQPPADAEVIVLSSSPEPVYEEHYAEDDVDDDYEASAPPSVPASRRSSARSSSSSVVASRKAASREPRAGPRGVNVPASARAKSAVSVLGGLSRGTKRVSSLAPPSSSSS